MIAFRMISSAEAARVELSAFWKPHHISGVFYKEKYTAQKKDSAILVSDEQNIKRHRQLKYLASKHEANILKLRFVLTPFSFIFLLS